MYHRQENFLDTCFSRLMFVLGILFLFLLQYSLIKILFNVRRVSLGCIVIDSSLIGKKGKLTKIDLSWSFVVTRCHFSLLVVIRCHSLSLVVPLIVICCHSLYQLLSLVVTRCITRLSFYKRYQEL